MLQMSKKDYQAFARIISNHAICCENCRECCKGLAYSLTLYFKEDNPNFDSQRFMKACGVEDT